MFEYLLSLTNAQAAAIETWNERHPMAADPAVAGPTAHAAADLAAFAAAEARGRKRAMDAHGVSDEPGMVSRAAVAARTGHAPYWQNDPTHTQLP